MGLIILPRTHTLDKSRVQPIDRVLPLRAMHLNESPEPGRTVCTSFFSLQVTRTFSFHVARETATCLCKSSCSQIFSATMYARDPRAHHHSSSSGKSFSNRSKTFLCCWVNGAQVHLPSFLMRQYNFAMYTASDLVYINFAEHQDFFE